MPKQFLKFYADLIMLQATVKQLRRLNNNIILESSGCNTASAIAPAALTAIKKVSILYCWCWLQNIVVVQAKDTVLVAAKDRVQDVKAIVQQLKDLGRSEHKIHCEVYRPWGKYDAIDQG